MKRHLGTMAVIMPILVLLAGLADGGDAKKSVKDMQGVWLWDKAGKKMTLTITGEAFALDFDGKGTFKGKFTVDVSKKPHTIDMMVEEGPEGKFKGKTALGIYMVDGDTLRWCANEPGKEERPKAFPEKEGETGDLLHLTLKRAK